MGANDWYGIQILSNRQMKYFLYTIALLLLNTLVTFGQTFDNTIYQADSLFWAGTYQKSEGLYTLAAELSDKKNTEAYYLCIQKKSECLVREGFFDAAEDELKKALLTCPAQAYSSKAGLYNVLGLAKIGKGEYDEAEAMLNEATQLSVAHNLSDALSDSYNNTSILYWTTGNNEKALSYGLNALALRQKMQDAHSPIIAGSYMNLGLLYQHSNPEQAITYYNQAIDIYTHAFQSNHPLIASAYINKGIVYETEKTYNSALEQFEKSAHIIEASVGKEHINYAFALSHIGKVYLEKGNAVEAEQYENKALNIMLANFGSRHPEVAQCYYELAAIKQYQHRYKEAIAYYQQSLISNSFVFNSKHIAENPNSSDYIHADLMLNTFLMKAQALEELHLNKDLKLKDLTSALKTLQSADTLSEKIRHRRTNKKDKMELGKITNDIYEQAVHLCLMLSEITFKKKQYLAQAFAFSEKNKAAVLLEAISEANAKSFSGLPDSLLQKESLLKNKIAFYELMLSKAEHENDKKQNRTDLLAANRSYETFIKKLEQDFPAYYKLKYPENSLTLKTVQAALDKEMALMHYFISDKYAEVTIFVVKHKSLKVIRKDKLASLDKDLIGWRNTIRYKIEVKYIELGNILSEQLLPARFPKNKHLVIIPDGRLSSAPFEALFTKKAKAGKPLPLLIKQASIAYNYSTALYLESAKESKVVCEKGNVLLCAPIHFKGNMSDLPGSQQEVKDLNTSFTNKGFAVTSQVGDNASEGNIKINTSSSWTYIHFATHGLVNENDPDLSKILLHASNSEDGDLYSGEIYNLHLNSELITLSACQTGLGKVTKGEGLIGLSRALIYAGANNIIVSLWNVSDEATVKLMNELYTNILNTTQCVNYAEALQKAKLVLINDKNLSEPIYWAPFILIGH